MTKLRRPSPARVLATAVATGALLLTAGPGGAVQAAEDTQQRRGGGFYTDKVPVSRGWGGAVTSVDPEASRIGLRVLKRGGNAVDAAVATAAALGVTEPYSAGIGGGGYFVYYDAKSGKVRVIDGRETAPESIPNDAFIDPETGEPYPATLDELELQTSGVSVGVPGTLATWKTALDRWGSRSLPRMLRPAAHLARRGFVVDETFALQTAENQFRFEAYTSSPEVFLPGGEVPEVGTVFRNPDLARTYRTISKRGTGWFYRGPLAREMAEVVQAPPVSPTTDMPVPAGYLERSDLARYRTIVKRPTKVSYRGHQVYGMPPSSSGGTTVGETLNILEEFQTSTMTVPELLHHYFEASALAYADRAAYLGDAAFVPVPVRRLLSQRFAAERACEIDPEQAAEKPVEAEVGEIDGVCDEEEPADGPAASDTENRETTNLTVADRWGNVVEYTLTIEHTGGSGLVVPDRGFLLNNELTDFSHVYDPEDPNRIEGGKRPRSSMSPTIVLRHGKPFLALGSPGGSTIITTVLQVLINRIDRGMPLFWAVEAPRAAQRNSTTVTAEQRFINRFGDELAGFGHEFAVPGEPGTSASEIGAVTAIEFGKHGRMVAVAEPTRRGGGSALVVHPR
jgi:gamma-glutamyltranspeptidase / glutathione hydrolase